MSDPSSPPQPDLDLGVYEPFYEVVSADEVASCHRVPCLTGEAANGDIVFFVQPGDTLTFWRGRIRNGGGSGEEYLRCITPGEQELYEWLGLVLAVALSSQPGMERSPILQVQWLLRPYHLSFIRPDRTTEEWIDTLNLEYHELLLTDEITWTRAELAYTPRSVHLTDMVRNGTVALVDELVDDPTSHPDVGSFGRDGEPEFAVRYQVVRW